MPSNSRCSGATARRRSPTVASAVLLAMAMVPLLLLILGAQPASGNPGDAQGSGCSDMTPVQSAAVQSSAAPYTLTASATSYTAGQAITVTLAGVGTSFEGYLLEARRSPLNTPIGQFFNVPTGNKLACSGAGVTHTTRNRKSTITVTWMAPTSGQGSVIFVATVVQSLAVFWTNVKSSVVTETVLPGGGAPSSTLLLAQALLDVNTTACDVSLACFRQPSGCNAASCNYVLAWSDAGNAISFEMSASITSVNYYLSFGLSHDTKMGEDSVVSCVYNSLTSVVSVEASWNAGETNAVLSDPMAGIVPNTTSGSVSNGRISCRFHRLKSVTGSTQIYPLDSASYNILLAKGPVSNDIKKQHSGTTKTSSKVKFTDYISAGASAISLVKAHGILMMLASFGMLLPQYFKPAWSNTMW